MSPLRGTEPQIGPYFQIKHCMVVLPSDAMTKLNVVAQLQIFPYLNFFKFELLNGDIAER